MSDSNKCWVRTDKDHGEGDGTYKLIYEENRSDVPQTAVIEIVSEDGNVIKEISVTQSPRKVYLSAMKQKVFTKNDCMADEKGSEVLYVVPSGQYKSYISQEDADAQAERDLNEYGQDYANANGKCDKYIWYNDEKSATRKRNNCPAGSEGSEVTYIVREGKHSSLVSKADANRKAQEDIDLNAQAYANENGTCTSTVVYQSKEVRVKKRRNNCEAGYTGEEVEYVVPFGKYTSMISQDDADAKAITDAANNAQSYANEHGACIPPTTYKNSELTVSKQKNDCEGGAIGSFVDYVVPAGKYTSTVSQDAADAMAEADAEENAQNYANEHGACSELYRSRRMEGEFTKNNCPEGQIPSDPITYVVEEGAFTSAISQEDADAQAEAELNKKGQAKANAEGTCHTVYWNVEKSGNFQKNDCEEGQKGSVVKYTVPAHTISSMISQADADAKAAQKVQDEGQAYANEHGICSSTTLYSSSEVRVKKTRNNCEQGYEGTEVEYVVEAGKYTSSLSQEDADAQAQADADANAQDYANEHGECNEIVVYRSAEVRVKKQRNNCEEGYTGEEVEYVVPAGKYTSEVSQEEADAEAQADAEANAQDYANEHGECIPPTVYENVELRTTLQKNDCSEGMKGTSETYVVPAGKYTSTVSQEDADAQAQADSDENAQNWVNENGSCVDIFENAEIRQIFTKNDCSEGMIGSEVEYVVDAGKYISEVSQEDADAQAQADVDENGQSYANKNGHCLYGNDRKSQMFTRNDCGADGVGSEVEYVVEENTFKSEESKEAANALADADIAANGQNYANEHGTCTELFKNVEMSEDFQKNDCGSGMKGSTVTYTVPAGKYSSIVSQDAANAKAQEDIEENGQNYANEHGECIDLFLSKEIREEVQKNDCENGMVGSMVEYVVDAGKYISEVSQADADKQAQDDFDENAQAYANKNGHCLYINDEKKQSFTRDNCGNGYEGTEVEYVVPAGKYQSEESKEAANALADADIAANGQNNANSKGECLKLYYSVQKSGIFTPECPSGQVADNYTYVVPAGKYTSTISQADADKKAQDDVDANGQAKANEQAECRNMYTSAEKRGTFYRNNCGTCYHGNAYVYVVEAGKYTSSVSQADADAQAQADVDENGQTAANKNGTCSADSTAATWTDTGSTQCNGCTSQKQQKDTNPCSSTYNQTKWVNGGGRNCTNWTYNGSGDCVGHTQYDSYRDSCSGSVDNQYRVSCSNCCNCGSYGSWQENGCSGTSVAYVRYDDCGRADTKTGLVCGKCGYTGGNYTATSNYRCSNGVSQREYRNGCGASEWRNEGTACTATNTSRYCKSGCACETCVEAGAVSGSGSTTSAAQSDANSKAQSQANGLTCKTQYSSAAKSGSATRNNCGSGCTGTSVTYTVPAGKYTSCVSQSDADTKAQNDVNSNKQSYANSQGKCNCIKTGRWSYTTKAYHETESVVSQLRFGVTFQWSGDCSPVATSADIQVMKGGSGDFKKQTVTIPTSWASGHEYIVTEGVASPDYGYRFGMSVVINAPTGTTC